MKKWKRKSIAELYSISLTQEASQTTRKTASCWKIFFAGEPFKNCYLSKVLLDWGGNMHWLSTLTVHVWWPVGCLMKLFLLAVLWRSWMRVGRFMFRFVGAREEPPLIGHAGSGTTAGRSLPWQPVLTWFSRRSSRLLHTVCLITPLQGSGKMDDSGILFASYGLNKSCLKLNGLFMFILPVHITCRLPGYDTCVYLSTFDIRLFQSLIAILVHPY